MIYQSFFHAVAGLAGFFVLVLGVMWVIYAVYEAKRRGSYKERKVEDWNYKITKFLKILTYLGIVVGVFAILSGVGGLILNVPPSKAFESVQISSGLAPSASIFTSVFLIILGFLTLFKPLNDLPITSVIGILVASGVVVLGVLLIPDYVIGVIEEFIDPRIFFAIIFIVVFAIIALTVKFYISFLMAISKAISWPILAFIIAAFCLVQAFLLLVFGVSITGLF